MSNTTPETMAEYVERMEQDRQARLRNRVLGPMIRAEAFELAIEYVGAVKAPRAGCTFEEFYRRVSERKGGWAGPGYEVSIGGVDKDHGFDENGWARKLIPDSRVVVWCVNDNYCREEFPLKEVVRAFYERSMSQQIDLFDSIGVAV